MLISTSDQAKPTVVICDDDQLVHITLKSLMKNHFQLHSAMSKEELLLLLKKLSVDIVILDVTLKEELEGIQILSELNQQYPEIAFLMLTGRSDFQIVREALKNGAEDYLLKSELNDFDLVHKLNQIMRKKTLTKRNQQLTFESKKQFHENLIIGESAPILQLKKQIERFRNAEENVLIIGETGTGKELVAKALRPFPTENSYTPFITIDSATISDSMAEAILFGSEKGAYTGADRTHRGLFEEADGGILYFDEIGNLPPNIQPKLLRVLQEKEIRRIGSTQTKKLQFRVISATNSQLNSKEHSQLTGFKSDLFQRLSTLPIYVPALRDRKEDIPLLVDYFLKKKGLSLELNIENEVLNLFSFYPWPGNVRELFNSLSYALVNSDYSKIKVSDLPKVFTSPIQSPEILAVSNESTPSSPFFKMPMSSSYRTQIAAFENTLLNHYFTKFNGNVSKMARSLQMDRSNLRIKLQKARDANNQSSLPTL